MQCPKGSRSTSAELEEIQFACMKRHQHKAQRMLRQLRNERVVSLPEDIEEYSKAENRMIEIPNKCVSIDSSSFSSVGESRRREMPQKSQDGKQKIFL